MSLDATTLDWLLDSDPAIRWQVERDLQGAPPEVWEATRARVSREGWGARLLAKQGADGQWAGGAYFPGESWQGDPAPDEPPHPDDDGEQAQPWIATTWSLTSLREWGADPAVLGDTAERIDAVSRWEYDELPYWSGEVDACINGMTLANGQWLGADPEKLALLRQWFLDHEMAEGGWNCAWVDGSTRASFHSTINTLKGLLAFEELVGGDAELAAARHRGEAYLLERHLLFRASTGDKVAPWATHVAYPFRWVYSAMNALDHFRRAAAHDGAEPDPRLAEAVEAVHADRQADGTWIQERRHPGRVWFEVDVPVGERSKWLTLYGTRVLDWWDAARTAA
ncbi:squalene cyclase [Homoserinibacter sp. YIM 151385]|uniref:squalene cyclase n=1 Tax=Homoserinibacter sp. YIM 151385 TaxID=2985506 RepID=UPI0022F0BBED|nr:squalene cyclase [Homoserinibacter sp. YIM 151385]WBU38973.1 squalene cyclase [Homoserinibacter sp. YIM 151385]